MQYRHLSVDERELIQYGLWDKKSVRTIAKEIGRSPSAISREINRNTPAFQRRYPPRVAHERALQKRTSRGRHDRLKNEAIRTYVISHLKEGWSPEQISGRIKLDLNQRISHEAIYQYIYAQIHRDGWGLLRPGHEDLRVYLRRRRKRRGGNGLRHCGKVPRHGGRSIDERPGIIVERSRVGDWEGDSVESKDHRPGLNTLVERRTGLVLMTKLSNKTPADTAQVVVERLKEIPAPARYTLTLDNGFENQHWSRIEQETGVTCYFAHPYHSWERGTNENTNGLIREYFPKKTDFSIIPAETIKGIENKLNSRPRKRLNYLTPLEAFSVALAG
ncbi:MAG: IS30 family transposase [Patescibacteria group bacterium]